MFFTQLYELDSECLSFLVFFCPLPPSRSLAMEAALTLPPQHGGRWTLSVSPLVAALARMPRCAAVSGDAARSTSTLPLSSCFLSYDNYDPPSAPD